jgi:hypothetical protein
MGCRDARAAASSRRAKGRRVHEHGLTQAALASHKLLNVRLRDHALGLLEKAERVEHRRKARMTQHHVHPAEHLVTAELGRAIHAESRVRIDRCQDLLRDQLEALFGLERRRRTRPSAPRGQLQ